VVKRFDRAESIVKHFGTAMLAKPQREKFAMIHNAPTSG
jgi:hypothetical protein